MKKWISSLTLMFLLLLAPTVGAAPHTYTDVPKTHPAYNDIQLLVEKGVAQKTSSYNLTKTMTREDVAVMVAKALNLDGTQTTTKFKDIPASHRASGYIDAAVKAGVITGYTDGTFRPLEPVTRGQMAAFLVRGFKLNTQAAVKFKDVTPSMMAYPFVSKLVAAKVTLGYSNGTFRPNDTVKKDQMSMFMARAIRVAEGSTPTPPGELTVKEIVQQNDEKVVLLDMTSRWGDMQGSGILIGNGLILTNHHVIDQATSGTVTFYNGKVLNLAGIVAEDEANDYAILKVAAPYSTAGVKIRPSSSGLAKGDEVVAIGSPLGLQNTVSTGVISSIRNWEGMPVIQTTADIDYGSSGGALFNRLGELIGVTTSGYDSTANLNFALASEAFYANVQSYTKQSYASIPASFTDYINELDVPNVGGLEIGMSQAEVKALNLGGKLEQYEDAMYYTGATILGSTADIYLMFINDNLVWIDILHDEGYGIMDKPTAEAYFEKMYAEMAALEGEADEIDRDWTMDEYGAEAWEAYWIREDFDIMIAVAMYEDGSMSGITVTLSGLFEE
ncbi:S-layer homology domain-containing protein [Chryseomicrobium palamuruense]|uniref:S-layer homology domain-containing protein n=1 Tax=Chryseomicrobium palamuruense TaxID=682973 RepID=A0ABV8UUR7_9BACL